MKITRRPYGCYRLEFATWIGTWDNCPGQVTINHQQAAELYRLLKESFREQARMRRTDRQVRFWMAQQERKAPDELAFLHWSRENPWSPPDPTCVPVVEEGGGG